ncbi:hypothetical protein B0185_04045 [Haemophilus parahaemolyticus]|nr:hypothetical protein B0185_04045 [Haemophilus parahaemolyticus]
MVIKIDEWKKQSFLSPACGRGRKKPKNFRSERENLRIIEENKPLSPLWLRILNEYEACLKHK